MHNFHDYPLFPNLLRLNGISLAGRHGFKYFLKYLSTSQVHRSILKVQVQYSQLMKYLVLPQVHKIVLKYT